MHCVENIVIIKIIFKIFARDLKLDLLLTRIGHGNEGLDLLDGDVIGEVE